MYARSYGVMKGIVMYETERVNNYSASSDRGSRQSRAYT